MKKITKLSTLKELALIIGKVLLEVKIDVVLVGGAVVSIYTKNVL